ncbi:Lrp/AsnC family transcriptional regulator [Candidatus Woesearchaeota archaeon]|nr:Lrp/AsnC family transcriptional regulator [Candidatus Woesearchaeota archaeon]
MRTNTVQKLLECLREDSRLKLQEISKLTKIPVSTLYDTLKILRRTIIKKFTTILDFYNLGYKTHAIIILKPNSNDKKKLQSYLYTNNNVNSLYNVDNNSFLIDAILKDNKELQTFIQTIESLASIENHEVYLVYEEFKHEEFTPKIISG